MDIIRVNDITKDFGNGKGVFDLTMNVRKGEVYGFLGPNGAGKTTTIRNLLGFTKPDKGSVSIAIPVSGTEVSNVTKGMDNTLSGGSQKENYTVYDCFKDAAEIEKHLGYLAGEIAFIDDMRGDRLLDFLADMKGLTDRRRMHELMERFELNPTGVVKKMSKGMKQKIGIINAFMACPEILILDEPTSGLDPLMQNRFVELILEEKARGTTILMSSHMFEEVERTCDRTAIINGGKLVAVEELDSLKQKKNKKYVITFADEETARTAVIKDVKVLYREGCRVTYKVGNKVSDFIRQLSTYSITDMSIETQSLEELFMHFYGTEISMGNGGNL